MHTYMHKYIPKEIATAMTGLSRVLMLTCIACIAYMAGEHSGQVESVPAIPHSTVDCRLTTDDSHKGKTFKKYWYLDKHVCAAFQSECACLFFSVAYSGQGAHLLSCVHVPQPHGLVVAPRSEDPPRWMSLHQLRVSTHTQCPKPCGTRSFEVVLVRVACVRLMSTRHARNS